MAFEMKARKTNRGRISVVKETQGWAKNRLLEPDTVKFEALRGLIDVAKNGTNLWDRLTAFKKLGKNVAALTEVATYFDDVAAHPWGLGYDDTRKLAVRELARMVKKLKNPAALVCVACYSANKSSRMIALEKLDGNAVALKRVVRYGNHEDAKINAVEKLADMADKLSDPECLRIVAVWEAYQGKNGIASKKLEAEDVNFVIDIAKHHRDAARRKSALEKLATNVAALREVAICGYYLNTSKEAINKLVKLSKELSDPLILNGLPKLL